MFFTFFKLYKYYQIAQRITYEVWVSMAMQNKCYLKPLQKYPIIHLILGNEIIHMIHMIHIIHMILLLIICNFFLWLRTFFWEKHFQQTLKLIYSGSYEYCDIITLYCCIAKCWPRQRIIAWLYWRRSWSSTTAIILWIKRMTFICLFIIIHIFIGDKTQ